MGLKKEKGVQKIVDQFVSSLEAPPEPSLTTDAPVSEGEDMILLRKFPPLSGMFAPSIPTPP